MKRKSPRYLGMTGVQIGVLAGLSFVALISICGGLWVILSTSTSLIAQTADLPPTPSYPSETPTPAGAAPTTAGPAATETPTAPPAATSVPPAGWVEFQAREVHLWLPGNFVGGDVIDHRSETAQKIDKLGKYFKNVGPEIRNAPKEAILWMVDKNIDQSVIITLVVVEHFANVPDTTIDKFVQDDLNSDANGTPVAMLITINETKKMTLLGHEARRLIFQQNNVAGHDTMGMIYYIKVGSDFWTVKYNLDPNEYVDMRPIVDQSIQTFYLTP